MVADVSLCRSREGDRAGQLAALRELVTNGASHQLPRLTTFTAHESPLAGLGLGTVHEWMGVQNTPDLSSDSRTGSRPRQWWSPCVSLLLESARHAAARLNRREMVWIGSAVWPYPSHVMGHGPGEHSGALETSLFVRALQASDRLWAADLALRNRKVGAVIVDGSGFDMASTRRLQLATELGGGMCLLARPPWERSELSAAGTRWMVSHCPSPVMTRRWTVELLRCKGMPPTSHASSVWTLERDRATNSLRVVADVLDRSRQTTVVDARATG